MMVESQSTRRGTEDGLRAHHHCLEAQGKMSSGRLVLGVVAAALCAGALFGGAPAGYAIPEDASSPQAAELFVPGLEMNRALEQLSDSVIEWDQGKAIDQGIRGILSGVGDPYASLITKSPKTPKGPGPGADLRVRGRSWPHSVSRHSPIPYPSFPSVSSFPLLPLSSPPLLQPPLLPLPPPLFQFLSFSSHDFPPLTFRPHPLPRVICADKMEISAQV
jgi:hypothetical protein